MEMSPFDFEEFLWARGCVEWLVDAGIVMPCYCLRQPELPLKGNYDESKYKLYMGDTGLLVSMLDENAQNDLRANRNLGIYIGALFENIVAEAFAKSGLDLYYWRRNESSLVFRLSPAADAVRFLQLHFLRVCRSREARRSTAHSPPLRNRCPLSGLMPVVRSGIDIGGNN